MEKNAKVIVKSKAMTSEEIHLNDAMEKSGYEVVESDTGEYIVQLREEAPYHLVFPRCISRVARSRTCSGETQRCAIR